MTFFIVPSLSNRLLTLLTHFRLGIPALLILLPIVHVTYL